MSILPTVNRDEFGRLIGLTSEALGRRASVGHLVLSFGCETTAEQGQYLAIDAIPMELADQLVHYGFNRGDAVALVRRYHERWFELLQEAEWGNLMAAYFAVGLVRYAGNEELAAALAALRRGDALAVAGLDADVLTFLTPHEGYFVASGTPRAIAEAVKRRHMHQDARGRGLVGPWVTLNMVQVLAIVQARARDADIELPRLTAEPGTAAEAAMRTEIAAYQKRSHERLRRKGRRRAPVSRKVRASAES